MKAPRSRLTESWKATGEAWLSVPYIHPYHVHKHTQIYICMTREIQRTAKHDAFCKGQLKKQDEKHTEKARS